MDESQPAIPDPDWLAQHLHTLSSTGSGKTENGLQATIGQLVARDDGSLVIFDCKGDTDLLDSVRDAAKRAGQEPKWFIN